MVHKKLKERELAVARLIRNSAKKDGVKAAKTIQTWRGKKHKCERLKKGDGKGIDTWRYVKYVARPILWPLCQQLAEEDLDFILMEDNAPGYDCWWANAEREKQGVKKMNWPPNSPDFNPIEQIWMLLRSRIQRRRGIERVTTIGRMNEVLVEEWDKLTVEEISKEISRLPHVMQRCSECNGGNNFHG